MRHFGLNKIALDAMLAKEGSPSVDGSSADSANLLLLGGALQIQL
jgi:hypothetical protein